MFLEKNYDDDDDRLVSLRATPCRTAGISSVVVVAELTDADAVTTDGVDIIALITG